MKKALSSLAAVMVLAASMASTAGATELMPEGSYAQQVDPHAVPSVAVTSEAQSAPYVDEEGNFLASSSEDLPTQDEVGPIAQKSLVAPKVGCRPTTIVDNPHISSKSSKRAVQGHGAWNKGGCTKATRAKVQSCLFEYFTSGKNAGYWVRKNCSPKSELRPGGGAGNRVTSHNNCVSNRNTSWRNHVDVDVIGIVDDSDTQHRQSIVACYVP